MPAAQAVPVSPWPAGRMWSRQQGARPCSAAAPCLESKDAGGQSTGGGRVAPPRQDWSPRACTRLSCRSRSLCPAAGAGLQASLAFLPVSQARDRQPWVTGWTPEEDSGGTWWTVWTLWTPRPPSCTVPQAPQCRPLPPDRETSATPGCHFLQAGLQRRPAGPHNRFREGQA